MMLVVRHCIGQRKMVNKIDLKASKEEKKLSFWCYFQRQCKDRRNVTQKWNRYESARPVWMHRFAS